MLVHKNTKITVVHSSKTNATNKILVCLRARSQMFSMAMKIFTGQKDKKGWGGQGKEIMYHYIPSVT